MFRRCVVRAVIGFCLHHLYQVRWFNFIMLTLTTTYLLDVWHLRPQTSDDLMTITMEQELFTLPEHLSSVPDFSGVRVTRSSALYVCFVNSCLSFWPFCCLFFFDIRIMIAPLVSSNSSYYSTTATCVYNFKADANVKAICRVCIQHVK